MKTISFSVLFLITMAFSCEKETTVVSDSDRLKALESEIMALIQDKKCTADRNCGSIGFGSKPCGGPWKYLVYSLNSMDKLTLEAKVAAYNGLEAQLNKAEGRMSDCMVVAPLTVGCVNGDCTTK